MFSPHRKTRGRRHYDGFLDLLELADPGDFFYTIEAQPGTLRASIPHFPTATNPGPRGEYWNPGSSNPVTPTGTIRAPQTAGYLLILIARRALRYPTVKGLIEQNSQLNSSAQVFVPLQLLAGEPTDGYAIELQMKYDGTSPDRQYAVLGDAAQSVGGFLGTDMTLWARPADYNTAFHEYSISVLGSLVEWCVDGMLKCVGVWTPSAPPAATAGPPYGILWTKTPWPAFMTPSVEYDSGSSVVSPDQNYDPYTFRAFEGVPYPFRTYYFYTTGTNTVWQNLAIGASVTRTSHFVPIAGFPTKVLAIWLSGISGTVTYELDGLDGTGTWRKLSNPAWVAGYNSVDLSAFPYYAVRIVITTAAGAAVTVNDAAVYESGGGF